MNYSITESRIKYVFKELIENSGLLTAIMHAGGIDNLSELMGEKLFPKDKMIEAIKELVGDNDANAILLFENGDSIYYGGDEDNYIEISTLFPNYVELIVWGKDGKDEVFVAKEIFDLEYEEISNDKLYEIIKTILEIKAF
jgi:hypothetical protein